jgi:hypothetical protein
VKEPETLEDWDEAYRQEYAKLKSIDERYKVKSQKDIQDFIILHSVQMESDKVLRELNYIKKSLRKLRDYAKRWHGLEKCRALIEAVGIKDETTGEKTHPNVEIQKAYAEIKAEPFQRRIDAARASLGLVEDEISRYSEYVNTLNNIGHDLRSETKMR